MNTPPLNVMPRETKVALILLWITLIAGAASLVPVLVNNWAYFSSQSAGWWFKALWSYPIHILLLLYLARGYGWIRWLLMISLISIFFVIFAKLNVWSELYEQLGVFLYVEPLVLIFRIAAIVLLFRPPSNNWYAQRRSASL